MDLLKPLYADMSSHEASNRFIVQLDVFSKGSPKSPALSESEIERILAMSSWEQNPLEISNGVEGIRSVTVYRQLPSERQALQINGIGWRPFQLEAGVMIPREGFLEPSQHNYYDQAPSAGGLYAHGSKLAREPSYYSPLGTMSDVALRNSIAQYLKIGSVAFDWLTIPEIKAYGRYRNAHLSSVSGPFGFIVYDIPDVKPRAGTLVREKIHGFKENHPNPSAASYDLSIEVTSLLMEGLKELHSKKIVHRTPHPDNYFVNIVDSATLSLEDSLSLMDWEAHSDLGSNRDENALNMAIDIHIGFDRFWRHVLLREFPDDDALRGRKQAAFSTALESYAYGLSAPDIVSALQSGLPKRHAEIYAIAEWIKENDLVTM